MGSFLASYLIKTTVINGSSSSLSINDCNLHKSVLFTCCTLSRKRKGRCRLGDVCEEATVLREQTPFSHEAFPPLQAQKRFPIICKLITLYGFLLITDKTPENNGFDKSAQQPISCAALLNIHHGCPLWNLLREQKGRSFPSGL